MFSKVFNRVHCTYFFQGKENRGKEFCKMFLLSDVSNWVLL